MCDISSVFDYSSPSPSLPSGYQQLTNRDEVCPSILLRGTDLLNQAKLRLMNRFKQEWNKKAEKCKL